MSTLKFTVTTFLLWFAMLCLFASIVGCQAAYKDDQMAAAMVAAIKEKPVEQKPLVLAWAKKPGSDEWSKFVYEEIMKTKLVELSPKDATDWCPNFKGLVKEQRGEFYAHLIALMAQRESSWNPAAKFQESFKDSKGKFVISRGLLQISQESANGYSCGITKAEMLHDPKVNLACTVKIIDRWVGRDGVISALESGKWKGIGRYWSVMRSRSKSYGRIQESSKKLEICKKS